MYAFSDENYEKVWKTLQEKYITESQLCSYLLNEWLEPHKEKFITCYINKFLHFRNNATSRSEGGHRTLKRNLKFSTGDLKTVVDAIELLLTNQRHDYLNAFEIAKTRLSLKLRVPILRELTPYVTPFALRLVLQQYKKIVSLQECLSACINVFTTTTDLSCSHKIQSRMYDGAQGGVLKLEDIHPHWRFVKPTASASVVQVEETPSSVDSDDQSFAVESLLRVQAPAVIRSKGRPSGSQNRRQQTAEQSSDRIPSQFERVEADMTIQHTQEQEEEQEKVISDTAPAVQSQDQPRGGRRGRRGPRGPRGQRGRGGRGVRGVGIA